MHQNYKRVIGELDLLDLPQAHENSQESQIDELSNQEKILLRNHRRAVEEFEMAKKKA